MRSIGFEISISLVIKMKKAKQRFPFASGPCAIQPQKAQRVSSPNERYFTCLPWLFFRDLCSRKLGFLKNDRCDEIVINNKKSHEASTSSTQNEG